MDLKQARDEFPITRSCVYLDSATYGPHSLRYVGTLTEVAERLSREPLGTTSTRIEQVRASAARLIHASPERVSFMHSTSEGATLLAQGLDWRSGDEVILYEHEFPGSVAPWLSLADRGVRVRVIPDRDRQRFELDDIDALLSPRTRVICVSLVNNLNGFRAPVAAIRELCAGRDIWIACDAVQAMGALDLDVAALGADVVAAHGYKFLLSGFGNSAVYFSDRALRELHLRMVGSRNSGGDTPELLHRGLTPPTDGKRFEISVPNLPSLIAMGESLDLLLEVGMEEIEDHVLDLSARLMAGARERGYGIASSELSGERSAVVSMTPTGMPAADVHAQLRERGVVCALRDGRLRFACHLFNTEEEIDEAVAALPEPKHQALP
ncbi:MAG: aminotransferase class V-fold PLP-dependent enzyme [Candidatus Dormibacteraceae bacterium]